MALRFGADVLPSERRPVAWYSPPVLLQAAREVLSSEDFQRNLDRRENFAGSFPVIDYTGLPGLDGFDFLADTGDGGNATHTVAAAATDAAIVPEGGTALKRPPLVVLGGDLAYPTASAYDYQYRFLEVFSLACPTGAGGAPDTWREVLAIPQNHDWFDSVTTFCRYFVGREGKPDFVGANARQTRTYFAARLPHGWWILGLDFALRGDIDRNQFEAFCSLWDTAREGPRILPGDNVILVFPTPYWTEPLDTGAPRGYTRRFQRLEHLLEAPPRRGEHGTGGEADSAGAGARVRLRLAGDLHHYACRTADADTPAWPGAKKRIALVTCGAAGAFGHVTHGAEVQGRVVMDRGAAADTVPESLGRRTRVGLVDASVSADAAELTGFEHDTLVTFPDAATSRWQALRQLPLSLFAPRLRHVSGLPSLLGQLFNSNLGFAAIIGLLYAANANVNALLFTRDPGVDMAFGWPGAFAWLKAMFSGPLAFVFNAAMVGGCIRLGWEGTWGWPAKLALGTLHGMAHGALVWALYLWAAALLGSASGPGVWALVGVAGAFAGALLFGLYFALLCGVFGQLTNNASGAVASEDHKGFLRFTLGAGGLTMHMLGCERVPRRWRRGEDGRPQAEGAPPRWRLVQRLHLDP